MQKNENRLGYKKTKVGWIPIDWKAERLGDFFLFKNGLNKEKKFFGQGTPIVNYVDVYRQRCLRSVNIGGLVTVSEKEQDNYSARKGDVFFTRTSETIDEIGLSSVLLDNIENAVFSGFVLRARPINKSLYDQFKTYCFSTHSARKEIVRKSSYTTRALTNGRFLSEVLLIIPSFPEQEAIAEVLECWDKMTQGYEKKIEKKRNIKKGLMQQLLSGKQRLPGFGAELGIGNDECRIPEGWKEVRLGEVIELCKNKFNPGSSKSHPCVELEHISSQSGLILDTVQSAGLNSTKNVFRAGDVLFGKLRPYLRKYALPNFNGVCSSEIWVLKGISRFLCNQFLFWLVQTNSFISAANATCGSKMPRADWGYVAETSVLLPSIEEQEAIAAVLSVADAEIKALEKKLKGLREQKRFLLNNLVTGTIRLPAFRIKNGE